MAYTKKTLLNLKQSLADKHDSGVLPTDSATLSLWIRLLNEGVAYCVEKLKPLKSTNLTTVSGAIALPDDFKRIDRVVIADGGSLLTQASQDEVVGQSGLFYWITGNQVDGYTLNTFEDLEYTVFYHYRIEEMDADADVCIIPDPEGVVCYAYSRLRDSETDPLGDSQKYMDECNDRLNRMVQDDQRNRSPFQFKIQANA